MKRGVTSRNFFRNATSRNTFRPRLEEFETRVVPAAPAAPTSLHTAFGSTTQVELVWTSNSTDETGFSIERNNVEVGQVSAHQTAFVDFGATVGTTYSYRVRAFNADGTSGYSNSISFRYQTPISFTPSPVGTFDGHQDIGGVLAAGSATFATNTYTLHASGADIWDVADSMHYVYKQFNGDGEAIVRLSSIGDNTDFWAKGGIMIRESLAPGARDAFALGTSQNGGHNEPGFQWRTNTAGTTADAGNHVNGIQAAPVFLRVTRSGNNFNGYWAHDMGGGMHGPWNQMGPTVSLDMAYNALVGLALTAHNNGLINTTTFDNLSFVQTQAGAATSLAVLAAPTATAGNVNLTVDARDAAGNRASGYAGSVHFTSSNTGDTIPGDYAFQAGDSGAHNFGFTFRTAGAHTITARDNAGNFMGTVTINVGPAAATNFIVAGFPLTLIAGTSGNVTVTAKDSFGNTDTNFTGFVHVTSSDGQAVLPADARLASGVGSFAVTLKTAGPQTITARDSLTGTIVGSQSGIAVSPAATSLLSVGGFPASNAGDINTFTVTAKDAYNNTTPAYVGMVHFTSSDPRALLQNDYRFQASDNGTHTFAAILYTAGTQSITATDIGSGSIFGTQSGLLVRPLNASGLVISGFPAVVRGRHLELFTVTAQDRYGNVATSYQGQVSFSSSDPDAVLEHPYTFTAADNGHHIFAGALFNSGPQTITATDAANQFAVSQQVQVVLPATNLDIQAPDSAVTGTPFQITITARDDAGNPDLFYTGTVTFSSTDDAAGLPADYTFQASDNGTATFTVTLNTEDNQDITATDTVNGNIVGTATVFVGTSGAPGAPGGQHQPSWEAVVPRQQVIVPPVETSHGGTALAIGHVDAVASVRQSGDWRSQVETTIHALDLVLGDWNRLTLDTAAEELVLARLA